jgi:hypothetical protein
LTAAALLTYLDVFLTVANVCSSTVTLLVPQNFGLTCSEILALCFDILKGLYLAIISSYVATRGPKLAG